MTPDPNLDIDIKDYLNTLDDEHDNEWFCTEHNLHRGVLAGFKAWLNAVEYDIVAGTGMDGKVYHVHTFPKRDASPEQGRTWVATFATQADAEMYIRQVIV